MFAPPVKAPKAKTASQAPPAHASKPPQRRPVQPGLGSAEQILALQRTIGNQAVLRLLASERQNLPGGTPADGHTQAADPERTASPEGARRASWDFSKIPLFAPDRPSRSKPPPPLLQRKLTIGQVNDPLEHEADRVADQMMHIPASDLSVTKAAPQLSPRCACGGGCPKCIEEQGHSKEAGGMVEAAAGEAPAIVHQVLRSPGQPLDTSSRAYFEPRFGQDFSWVQIHTGVPAERSARAVAGNAYTVGNHIVFGAGQFAPGTNKGRWLIAHELAHVVQQQASQASIQRQPTTGGRPPSVDPFEVYDQIAIIKELILPLPFHNDPAIRKESFSERQDRLFKRKLAAIDELGNMKNERAVPILIAVIEDKEVSINDFNPLQKEILKKTAAGSLAKIGGTAALSKLNDLLRSKDPKERLVASGGLSEATGGQAVSDLLTALKKETDANVKAQIITALGKIGVGSATNQEKDLIARELLTALKKETDADTKVQIIVKLGDIGSGSGSDQGKELIAKGLIHELTTSTGAVGVIKRAAADGLGKMKLKIATEPLMDQLVLWQHVERIAEDIIRALGEIRDDLAIDLLIPMLEKASESVRREAATALGKIGGSKAIAALRSRLKRETKDSVREAIFKAIAPPVWRWKFASDQS
jgi:HEAT repeat protein